MRGDHHARSEKKLAVSEKTSDVIIKVGQWQTYSLATGKESLLFSPEIRHHGDENTEDDGKEDVSGERERTAGVDGGGCADGADTSSGRKEADGSEDAETEDAADFTRSGIGAVIIEEAVCRMLNLVYRLFSQHIWPRECVCILTRCVHSPG